MQQQRTEHAARRQQMSACEPRNQARQGQCLRRLPGCQERLGIREHPAPAVVGGKRNEQTDAEPCVAGVAELPRQQPCAAEESQLRQQGQHCAGVFQPQVAGGAGINRGEDRVLVLDAEPHEQIVVERTGMQV